MVQRYISHSISNTLYYSSEIHPYVGEFRYLCCFIEGRIMKKYGVDRDKESCKLLQAMPEEGFRLLFGR